MKNMSLKKIVLAGIFTALSIVLISFVRIPIFPAFPFLILDGGDLPILLSGFLLGPWWGLAVTVAASLIQAFVFSTDGIIGGLMHIIASGTFVVISSYVYKKWHTIKGALLALIFGGIAMMIVMIPANLFITSYYYKMTVEAVAAMLVFPLIPFNAVKAIMNTIIIMLIYKPISRVLHKVDWH